MNINSAIDLKRKHRVDVICPNNDVGFSLMDDSRKDISLLKDVVKMTERNIVI